MENIACKIIKRALVDEGVKMIELNEKLNQINGTSFNVSNLSQKINNGTIRFNDVINILELLGYSFEVKKQK